MLSPSVRLAPWLFVPFLAACRDGTALGATFVPVVPSDAGTQGCGPNTPIPGSATPVFASAAIGPLSQIAGVAGEETLYLTGGDGSVHELSFPIVGGAPVDTVLVAPGTIEADFLVPAGIAAPAQLSGIAVLDDQFLVVAEHSSNTLLLVRRDLPDEVSPLAGVPLTAGGYSDGLGGTIRFHFTAPAALFADARGIIFVADSENHAVRRVDLGVLPFSTTITGSGAPGSESGALPVTQLDTPSGLSANCAGELLVVESGAAGVGGNRLMSLSIGETLPLGGFDGSSLVLAGDGTNATAQGIDTAATLGTPGGLAATRDGLVFWVDAKEGVLRRYDVATGLSDCPLFADCAAAVLAGGSFTGAHFSLALADSGALYVLEADAGQLYRIDP